MVVVFMFSVVVLIIVYLAGMKINIVLLSCVQNMVNQHIPAVTVKSANVQIMKIVYFFVIVAIRVIILSVSVPHYQVTLILIYDRQKFQKMNGIVLIVQSSALQMVMLL